MEDMWLCDSCFRLFAIGDGVYIEGDKYKDDLSLCPECAKNELIFVEEDTEDIPL